MEYDAFTGGVAPGGLRSKSDIRILICYMLKSRFRAMTSSRSCRKNPLRITLRRAMRFLPL